MKLRMEARTLMNLLGTAFGIGSFTTAVVIGMFMEGFPVMAVTTAMVMPIVTAYLIYHEFSTTNRIKHK